MNVPWLGACQSVDQAALAISGGDVIGDGLLRCGVNHGAHVCGQVPRVAHVQFVHRPFQHCQQFVGDILLHIKAAQRRAALARRAERPVDDVTHRMFGQGGAIDDHRVQTAGFGDQRRARRAMRGHDLRIFSAVAVEPVKATPLIAASDVRAAPTSPAPGSSCRADFGTPAA